MATASLPDGTGVIRKNAPPGKVFAFYIALISTGALGTLGVLVALGLVGREAKAAPAHPPTSTLEEKVEQIAGDVREIKTEVSNQSRDIAVIRRQLGIDGLGPPPVRTSGPARP